MSYSANNIRFIISDSTAPGVSDVLDMKYNEAIEQGIGEGEMSEYLSDNTDESIDDIIEFLNSK